jgi:orotidine-5'-phosphate decarboxylase
MKAPIIVALDAPWRDSKIWIQRLRGKVWGFKVGSILFSETGPRVIDSIQKAGFKVFLDLKFHDIPNTVQLATRRAFSWGVDLLTVHSCGGRAMLEAAAAEQKKGQSILAVTVLTSLDSLDLQELGIQRDLKLQVRHLGSLAMSSGIRGLVCSPREAADLRKKFRDALLVTPGVRFEQNTQDQKRTETLEGALKAGASFVVLGRALTESQDWKKTWQKVICSMEETR